MDKLKPIPIKDRYSVIYLEKGQLDVVDGACVLVDVTGTRIHIPIGSVACLMLEPGIRVSHAAVALAARVGCLLIWIGEASVRLYSSGHPGGCRSDRLLYQAQLALDETARLKVIRKMFTLRFGDEPPQKRSPEQLRGIEGERVKRLYEVLAKQHGVSWQGRKYECRNWEGTDVINRCLSSATACLYGLVESSVLAAGYSPAIGFLHTGKPLSFVYDIADIFKFETVIPIAFKVASKSCTDPEREVRLQCRDCFRKTRLLSRVIPCIEEVLSAGDLQAPLPHEEAMPIAIPNEDECI
jgi:CRISPR-associated protein Cas1